MSDKITVKKHCCDSTNEVRVCFFGGQTYVLTAEQVLKLSKDLQVALWGLGIIEKHTNTEARRDKALLDLYNPPQVVTTAEFNIPADRPPYDMNGEGVCVNNGGVK